MSILKKISNTPREELPLDDVAENELTEKEALQAFGELNKKYKNQKVNNPNLPDFGKAIVDALNK